MNAEPRMITAEAAGTLLNLTPRQVRSLIRSGELPGRRWGRVYRIDSVKLRELIDGEGTTRQKE